MIMLRRKFYVATVAPIATLALIAGCGGQGPIGSGTRKAPASDGVAGFALAYVVPGDVATADGGLYLGPLSLSGPSTGTLVGQATDVWQDGSGSPTADSLLVTGYDSSAETSISAELTSGGDVRSTPLPSGQIHPVVGRGPHTTIMQVGDTIQTFDSDTMKLQNSVKLPTLRVDSEAGTPPSGYKGSYQGTEVKVSGIASLPSGPVATLTTGRSVALFDTSREKVYPLTGYGQSGPMTVDADGTFYIAAWRRYSQQGDVHILNVSPVSFDVISDFDTGVPPDMLRNISLVSTATHGVLACLFSGDEKGVTATIQALKGGQSASLGVGVSFTNVGLDASAGGDPDLLYLFGGPAKEKISALDLVTDKLIEEPARLGGPAGSFVVGVGPTRS